LILPNSHSISFASIDFGLKRAAHDRLSDCPDFVLDSMTQRILNHFFSLAAISRTWHYDKQTSKGIVRKLGFDFNLGFSPGAFPSVRLLPLSSISSTQYTVLVCIVDTSIRLIQSHSRADLPLIEACAIFSSKTTGPLPGRTVTSTDISIPSRQNLRTTFCILVDMT
jgi:hypothetical protein